MDIFKKIKNYVASHKKVSIAVLVLTLVSAICISSYVLSTNKQTVNNEKVTETTKNDSTVKKDDTKTSDEKKSDTKKDDKKEDKKSDTKVEETKTTEVTDTNTSTNVSNTTSTNVSNTTSTNTKNTESDNGCKTVYHEAVTHNVYHEAVTQQVWVVDTPAHDETTYTTVYYAQLSNGEKMYYDGTADWQSRVADYAATNRLVYGILAENQPNTVHYDEVGHYETQVVSQAWTETVVDTPAYTTCE